MGKNLELVFHSVNLAMGIEMLVSDPLPENEENTGRLTALRTLRVMQHT
jgi:hypothetical protein